MNNLNWHFTAEEVRAIFIDARGFLLFPLVLLTKSLILLVLACIFLVFFVILRIKGMSWSTFKKKFRIRFLGNTRGVRPRA